jgi:hypothetical protein
LFQHNEKESAGQPLKTRKWLTEKRKNWNNSSSFMAGIYHSGVASTQEKRNLAGSGGVGMAHFAASTRLRVAS